MSAAFSKHPGHEGLISLAFNIVTLNEARFDSLQSPDEPLPVDYEFIQCAFDAFAAIGNKPKVQLKALVIVGALLRQYPAHLRTHCNVTDILARLINGVLDVAAHHDLDTAFRGVKDVVTLLKLLDKSELEELGSRGVYTCMRRLLPYYEVMEAQVYEQVVTGVNMLTTIVPRTDDVLAQGDHVSLLGAAKTFLSCPAVQVQIWGILTLHCRENEVFAGKILAQDVLSVVSQALQQNNADTTEGVLQFVISFTNPTPGSCMSQLCLEHSTLMECLLKIVGGEMSCREEDVCNVCGLLAEMCEGSYLYKVIEYKLLARLEDCARRFPRTCALPAFISITGMLSRLRGKDAGDNGSLRAHFFSGDHYLFIRDMLSNSEIVSNSFLVELIYSTFQSILEEAPPYYLIKTHSLDFVRCFITSCIRDVASFPEIATTPVFTAHLFLSHLNTAGPISICRDLGLHGAITNILKGLVPQDLLAVTLGLLSCLTSKYHEHLKDLKPLLDCNVLDVTIEKALEFGEDEWDSQSGADVHNILSKMTMNADMTRELFKRGCMDKFLEMFGSGSLPPVTQSSVLNCIGNIALGGYEAKRVLMERMFHYMLLDILKSDGELSAAVPACCRLLHILATVEPYQRELLEAGCAQAVIDLVRAQSTNPNICCSALGLLGIVTTGAIRQGHASLGHVVELATGILKMGLHGSVVSRAVLVLMVVGHLDVGAGKLRGMEHGGVTGAVAAARGNIVYNLQEPNLKKWATQMLEEVNLYTIGVRPAFWQRGSVIDQPPETHACNWPPPLPPSPRVVGDAGQMASDEKLRFRPHFPVTVELDDTGRQQLLQLGINTSQPLFRVGRVYGSSYGTCKNCKVDGASEELIIRTHGLTPHQYQGLIDNGWYRRGGVKMFRLRQNHRAQCCDWETRVLVQEFDYRLRKSYSKLLRRIPTDRLTVESLPTHFSRDAFDLYNEYNYKKHDKTPKCEHSYVEHAVDSVISSQTVNGIEYGTYHQLYRLDGKLVAVSLIDIVPKGIVSLYMWYSLEKEVSKYSLGVYSALKEIEFVRELSKKNPEMKYYYLQGWNENNKKVAYKANYSPESFYCACITPEWLPSLEAVKEAKEKYLREHTHDQNGLPSSNATTSIAMETTDKGKKVSPDVPCSAFENDKAKYQQLTGHRPDVSKMVVCLNYTTYMYLGEVFSRFGVDKIQRELMERRFEELIVAIGPELSSQLIIDLKAT